MWRYSENGTSGWLYLDYNDDGLTDVVTPFPSASSGYVGGTNGNLINTAITMHTTSNPVLSCGYVGVYSCNF